MNSKERVLRVLSHKEADRVPLDLMVLGEAKTKLLNYYKTNVWENVLEKMEIDVRWVNEWEDTNPVEWQRSGQYYYDNWGIKRRDIVATEHYMKDIDSIKKIDQYRFPEPESALDYDRFFKACEKYDKHCVLAVVWGHFFTLARDLVGMENLLIKMIEIPDVIKYLFKKITDYYLEVQKRIYEKVGNKIDILYFGEDLGTQDSLMISSQMIRSFIIPNLKRMFMFAKKYDYKICFHSCGAVKEVIPDLIAAGVDILDPIQPRARGMDIFELKDKYGKDLCFHGNIDTQKVLPFGTKKMVIDEVVKLIKGASQNGGLIIAPDQFIQSDVPVENIVTLFESARSFGRYNND
jgi:uroporphyrinogen decarboxylase